MAQQVEFRDPPIAQKLFGTPGFGWLWLPVRVYLGYEWLQAGIHKLEDPAWMAGGQAVKSFWERAIQVPAPPARPPVAFDWYREFLRMLLEGGHYTWFAPLIAFGETLVGIALILGAFTGIAAFLGAFMNFNFMMAGSASTNPVMFILAVLLILAWKNAGWIGLDRWLLPALGTPWQPGKFFGLRRRPAAA